MAKQAAGTAKWGQGWRPLLAASAGVPAALQGVGVPVSTSHGFCQGFHGPTCTPWGWSPAAPHISEEGHQGSTPGLRAELQCTSHIGQDPGTQCSPMMQEGRVVGGPGSHMILCDGSLVYKYDSIKVPLCSHVMFTIST